MLLLRERCAQGPQYEEADRALREVRGEDPPRRQGTDRGIPGDDRASGLPGALRRVRQESRSAALHAVLVGELAGTSRTSSSPRPTRPS
ncbi:hypothetical protein ACU686_35555 [Yinghuangia aomiensis]